MSPGVLACNRLITVLAMAPSGLCPNSARGEVCGTANFSLSKCEDLSKMTSQWLPLSVKRVASATDEPFHQFIYTLRDTCCQIICCDLMEFDYFMMCKVSQWQHFWQFFILWIITIVQSPGVLKHNNQHHIHVPNYQNGKIGWTQILYFVNRVTNVWVDPIVMSFDWIVGKRSWDSNISTLKGLSIDKHIMVSCSRLDKTTKQH
jgi:hypothetical protein